MLEEVQERFEGLEDGRRQLLTELRGMTIEQRTFRPRPGAWSALEVAHHIVLAEKGSFETMIRLRDKASAARTFRNRLGYAGVRLVLALGLRARLRKQPAPPESSVDLEEVEGEWRQVRNRLREFLEQLPREGLRQAGFKHPIAGPLNVQEGLLFLEKHLRHHLRQIDRLRRATDYPRDPALRSG